MKAAIIIPYFGQWPKWMDLWVYSVWKNPGIDYILFTDITIPPKYKAIPNLFFQYITMPEYISLASTKLGKSLSVPNTSYKMCDYKPFYGLLHKELLSEYDYWGFGDIDLVLGDMSGFLNEIKNSEYDVVSTSKDRLSGPLCLLRNNMYYCNLCLSIKNWHELLNKSKTFALDERALTNKVIRYHRFCAFIYNSLRRVIRVNDHDNVGFILRNFLYGVFDKILGSHKLFLKETFSSHTAIPRSFMNMFFTCDKWTYRNGVIIGDNGMEFLYLHFLFLKQTHYLKSSIYWNNDFFYQLPDVEDLHWFDNKTILIDHKAIYCI